MSEFFTTLDQLEDAQSQCHCLVLSLRDTLRKCESDLAVLARKLKYCTVFNIDYTKITKCTKSKFLCDM